MNGLHLGLAAAALLLSACTYGAPAGMTTAIGTDVMTIDVDLTLHPDGYAPDSATVPVGTRIQFRNSDSFAHTATAIAAPTFPDASPFDASAETASGSALSGGWSSGVLQAGSVSPVFTADRPGTYRYGCFFHYGSPMRGTIVVR